MSRLLPRHRIDGHAIVSAEGAIADQAGAMPPGLRVEADWVRFQRGLDESRLVVLGRTSHEAAPNPGRTRLVLTSAAHGLERIDALTWRLDPDAVPLERALARLVPEGGVIAVPGGTRVFDLFLRLGFDRFDLTVVANCRVAGGRPVFSGVASAEDAMARLAAHGLREEERVTLDDRVGAVLHRFRRASGGLTKP